MSASHIGNPNPPRPASERRIARAGSRVSGGSGPAGQAGEAGGGMPAGAQGWAGGVLSRLSQPAGVSA